jgi:ferritin
LLKIIRLQNLQNYIAMINKTVEKAIINQIKNEEHSSRLYMAMASWSQTKGYHGASQYLFNQAVEERVHMLKFLNYLNDRGGYATLSALPDPTAEYKSLTDVFEKVLAHEEFITGTINALYEIAITEKDYTSGTFLQWYINEQIEEEATVQNILDKMKLTGGESAGLFHIDKELSALAVQKAATLVAGTAQ